MFQQAKLTELEGYKTQIDKFKTTAAAADATSKIEMEKQIKTLETKMEESKAKLAELKKADYAKFDTMKKGVEASCESLKTAFTDADKVFKA